MARPAPMLALPPPAAMIAQPAYELPSPPAGGSIKKQESTERGYWEDGGLRQHDWIDDRFLQGDQTERLRHDRLAFHQGWAEAEPRQVPSGGATLLPAHHGAAGQNQHQPWVAAATTAPKGDSTVRPAGALQERHPVPYDQARHPRASAAPPAQLRTKAELRGAEATRASPSYVPSQVPRLAAASPSILPTSAGDSAIANSPHVGARFKMEVRPPSERAGGTSLEEPTRRPAASSEARSSSSWQGELRPRVKRMKAETSSAEAAGWSQRGRAASGVGGSTASASSSSAAGAAGSKGYSASATAPLLMKEERREQAPQRAQRWQYRPDEPSISKLKVEASVQRRAWELKQTAAAAVGAAQLEARPQAAAQPTPRRSAEGATGADKREKYVRWDPSIGEWCVRIKANDGTQSFEEAERFRPDDLTSAAIERSRREAVAWRDQVLRRYLHHPA